MSKKQEHGHKHTSIEHRVRRERIAKALLTATSIVTGLVLGIAAWYIIAAANPGASLGLLYLFCVFVGLGVALIYPLAGAFALTASEKALNWAFPDRKEWTVTQRAFRASAWPLVLIGCVVVSLYFGIVDRIYR